MDGMLYWEVKLSTIFTFQHIVATLLGLLRNLGVGTRADYFSPQGALIARSHYTKTSRGRFGLKSCRSL